MDTHSPSVGGKGAEMKEPWKATLEDLMLTIKSVLQTYRYFPNVTQHCKAKAPAPSRVSRTRFALIAAFSISNISAMHDLVSQFSELQVVPWFIPQGASSVIRSSVPLLKSIWKAAVSHGSVEGSRCGFARGRGGEGWGGEGETDSTIVGAMGWKDGRGKRGLDRIRMLPERWEKVVTSDGQYFESYV
ncbi:hypothetical protein ALC53_08555 [Atta colombica]|uniref:Uncharacterized protein n=1 Tax=Atta colombica TaxID=520822 RepID=A0A151I2K3_9HYME|nr:hypothetical protein ALC53_08555 [Atta colombica]